MCGNLIMLRNKKGEHCLVMSEKARQGFRQENLKELEKQYRIISTDINVIETIGGGSARCMIAELF